MKGMHPCSCSGPPEPCFSGAPGVVEECPLHMQLYPGEQRPEGLPPAGPPPPGAEAYPHRGHEGRPLQQATDHHRP